jgi:cell volume regulation protein A
MSTAILIIIIGLFIFWGHYLANIFERKGIPDVVGLMLIGILIGPVFHWVDPSGFGDFGPLFTNLVLIFILFESGTDLRIGEVKASARESAGITVLGFFTTWIVITLSCMYLFDLSVLASLFVGAALGGTSSAVVVGLVRKASIRPRTSTTLIMESVETDVFTLAIPITILSLMLTGEFNINQALSHLISSLVIALVIGIGGGFLWSFILNRFPTLKNTKFITPAFLFILYGITEYLNFSGPLTALSFGIAIGNLQYLEPRFLERIVPNQEILLSTAERNFFSELVFLLRTFFFVFIGLSIKIDRIDWLLLGALVVVFVGIVRLIIVPIVIPKSAPVLDKAIISSMIPKGLGAAVVATLPFQQGIAEGAVIQAICFSVILFSTLYTVLTFFLINSGISLPFYRLLYGKSEKAENAVENGAGEAVISKARQDDLSRMK